MELLVIGLDGLSYNMLDRFDVDPDFLGRIRSKGVSGHLMSVDTPTTIPAWTSFATGKDPGSHGISNMTRQSPDYEIGPSRPNRTDAAAYDLLNEALFVNLPASNGRIPQGDDSYLVSGMLSKNKYEATPDDLQELDSFDDYILDHDASLKARPKKYLDHVLEITNVRYQFGREAFVTFEPRVGFLLFSTPDWAGHILSNLGSEAKRREFYKRLVREVDERARDLADLSDNIVLMSDHGFEYKHTNIHVSEWLAEQNLFTESSQETSAARIAVDIAKAVAKRSNRLYKMIRRVHNHIMGTKVGSSLHDAASPNVDYRNSMAWELRYGCIYVNDDRFESPQVEDPEQLKMRIQKELSSLTGPEGDPIFRDVLFPGEAYEDPGPDAPDLIARPAPHHFPTTLWSPKDEVTSPTENYEHRYRGVFLAQGPLFDGGQVENMKIIDVLPTILTALNEPLSPEFDGESRNEILARADEPTFMDPSEVPDSKTKEDLGTDQNERDDLVTDRLADLGYIE